MDRHTFLTAVFLGAMFCGFVAESRAQYCDFPPKGIIQGQRREYRGLYENKAYGYSVVIPAYLDGYDGENPFYQRGFGILLGAEPKSYILVNSEKNSLEFAGPVDAASQILKYLGKHGNKVESSKITESQLGTLKAALLVAAYSCPGQEERNKMASMVAISPERDNLYEITLYARSERFEEDRSVLDSLVKSWKYIGK